MPVCSVIIRCYNEENHIGRLLYGILVQTINDVEIIVVDSGSTDRTLEIANQYPVKVLHIAKDEFSFGRALNLGCAAATSEFLVFASAHVYPLYRDWLEKLLLPFKNPQIGLTYGKQRGAETTQFSEHQVFASWFPEETDLLQTHPFCNNANAAVRQVLWQEQHYDESLTGLEDLDWAKRIMKTGYYLAYMADAEIIHVHEESLYQTYNRYRREAIAFKRIYPDAEFSFWDFLRLWLVNTGVDYCHAIRGGKFLAELVGIPKFRFAQFWGTYSGYAQHLPVTQQLKRNFYYPDLNGMPDDSHAEKRQVYKIDYSSLE